MTTKEYTGMLLGGPNDGTSITSSMKVFPTTETIEMWLDGKGEDKDVNQTIIRGVYVWRDNGFFQWQHHSTAYYRRKKEVE